MISVISVLYCHTLFLTGLSPFHHLFSILYAEKKHTVILSPPPPCLSEGGHPPMTVWQYGYFTLIPLILLGKVPSILSFKPYDSIWQYWRLCSTLVFMCMYDSLPQQPQHIVFACPEPAPSSAWSGAMAASSMFGSGNTTRSGRITH